MAALVCAAVYLLGGTELLPMLLAMGAGWEGLHTVQVARGADHLTVVLRHERGAVGQAGFLSQPQDSQVQHRHGTAATLFCLLASRSAPLADHVAAFSAAQTCERAAGRLLVRPPFVLLPGAACSLPLWAQAVFTPVGVQTGGRAYPSQPPASLTLLRSIVLLV